MTATQNAPSCSPAASIPPPPGHCRGEAACHALSVDYGQPFGELSRRPRAPALGACEHRVVDVDLGSSAARRSPTPPSTCRCAACSQSRPLRAGASRHALAGHGGPVLGAHDIFVGVNAVDIPAIRTAGRAIAAFEAMANLATGRRRSAAPAHPRPLIASQGRHRPPRHNLGVVRPHRLCYRADNRAPPAACAIHAACAPVSRQGLPTRRTT